MRSIRDAELERADACGFNVLTDKDNNIIDDTKIREALPTIEYVIQQRGCLILMSHLGRPKGKPDEKYSLKKVADRLSHLIHRPVAMAPAAIGPEVAAMVEKMQPGDEILLENALLSRRRKMMMSFPKPRLFRRLVCKRCSAALTAPTHPPPGSTLSSCLCRPVDGERGRNVPAGSGKGQQPRMAIRRGENCRQAR